MALDEEKSRRDVDGEVSSSLSVSEKPPNGSPDSETLSSKVTIAALGPWSGLDDDELEAFDGIDEVDETAESLPREIATDPATANQSDLEGDGYLALGPLSETKRKALLAFLTESAPGACFFLCRDKSDQWRAVPEPEAVLSQSAENNAGQVGPEEEAGEFSGWQATPLTGADDSDCIRGEDEDTLRVSVLEETATIKENTLQVSVRRPRTPSPDSTMRFVLKETQALTVEEADSVKIAAFQKPEEEVAETRTDASATEEPRPVESAPGGEEPPSLPPIRIEPDPKNEGERAKITVERTKRFNKNTPEYTRVIQTANGGKKETPKSPSDLKTAEEGKRPPEKERRPRRKPLVARGNPDANRDKQAMRRQSRSDISMQVDFTAMIPGGREDTSPLVIYDERAHNRIRYQVSLTLSSSSNFWTGLAQDISGGGLFVATYNILPLGTQFGVTFTLPDGKPKINGVAEVRWLREYNEGLEVPPGMGVCFLDLSDENRRRIDHFVKNRETIFFED